MARAARLGGYLRAAGAGPETVVGLCLDRGPEMIVAMVGIVAGGGGVPAAGPGLAAARLAFTLADGRVAVVAGTGEALESGCRRVAAADRDRRPGDCGGGGGG